MSARTVRLEIHGRVQGVWYRAWTQQTAGRLGLSGWVQNRPNGSVDAVVSGPAEQVEAMIAACRDGPPEARVDRVDVSETSAPPGGGFEVRR